MIHIKNRDRLSVAKAWRARGERIRTSQLLFACMLAFSRSNFCLFITPGDFSLCLSLSHIYLKHYLYIHALSSLQRTYRVPFTRLSLSLLFKVFVLLCDSPTYKYFRNVLQWQQHLTHCVSKRCECLFYCSKFSGKKRHTKQEH